MDKKSYEKEQIGQKLTTLGLQEQHLLIDVKDSAN